MGLLKTHTASFAIVAAGGTLGAASREALIWIIPTTRPIPWAILIANVCGALFLGLLLQQLSRRRGGPAGTKLRLLLGTGFCGGFTTYSSLALASLELAGMQGTTPAPGLGVAVSYALGTLVVGGLATWLGMLLGSLGPATHVRAAEGNVSFDGQRPDNLQGSEHQPRGGRQ